MRHLDRGEVIAVQRRLPDTSWTLYAKEGKGWRSIAEGSVEAASLTA